MSNFRNFLNDWISTRKSDGDLERYLNTPRRILWPDLPNAPDYDVPFELGKNLDGEPVWVTGSRFRGIAIEKGQYCFRWERPPYSRLLKNANGDLRELNRDVPAEPHKNFQIFSGADKSMDMEACWDIVAPALLYTIMGLSAAFEKQDFGAGNRKFSEYD